MRRGSIAYQRVGSTRDHTTLFRVKREEAKERTEQTLSLISQGQFGARVKNAYACQSCGYEFGYFERRSQCYFCEKTHCSRCLNLLSFEKILTHTNLPSINSTSETSPSATTSTLNRSKNLETSTITTTTSNSSLLSPPPETFFSCKKCEILIFRQEEHRIYALALAAGAKHPLRIIYEKLIAVKRRISGIFPHYEHVVSSIAFENSSTGSAAVFDPFANPKTVGFSFSLFSGSSSGAGGGDDDAFIKTYTTGLEIQSEMDALLARYTKLLKILSDFQSRNEKDMKLRDIIKTACTFHVQEIIPKFRSLKSAMALVQVNKATQLYLVIYQLTWEDRQNSRFWSQHGAALLDALQEIRSELQKIVVGTGQDWTEYKKKVEDFLVDWEKHNQALLRVSAADQTEGTLIRKTLSITRKAVKQIDRSVGGDRLPATRAALEKLATVFDQSYRQASEL
jgi:hypothetical protein